jgi:hypothetical protein
MLKTLHLDFWNNPLVVTAMRLKYRRGSPGMRAAVWVAVLLGVGALLNHLSQNGAFRFPTAYLVAILSIQGLVSAAMAVVATSNSMNSEVNNRTLDFQRIVTLSPREILLGKMIGEPAQSYFWMIASMPLAAVCWGLGAASGATILWFYVNILTFTLMWAAIGLIHTLQPPVQVMGRQRSGGGVGMVLLFAVVPQLMIHGVRLLDKPGAGDLLQLVTPLGSLIHLWRDDPWQSQVAFWGLHVPSLVAAPVVQLTIAAWIVAAMTRRLKNLLNPIVSKSTAYASVAVIDLVFAGLCYSWWLAGYDATQLVYGYCLAHVVLCFLMMFFVVPRSPALVAWLWRRDGSRSAIKQALADDRTDVSAAAAVFALIGIAVLLAALVTPIQAAAGGPRLPVESERLAEAAGAMAAVVVAMGVIHQLCVAAAPKGGAPVYVLFAVLVNGFPPIMEQVLVAAGQEPANPDMLPSLSPAAMFVMNMTSVARRQISALPVIAAYAALAAVGYVILRRWLSREAATVRRKLASMAVAP